MIDVQEFLNAGFSDAQASALVRAFEITERNSAQRFALLQSAMNEGFVRVEQRIDGLEQRMDGLEQRIGELTNAVGELARVVAQGFATMEQTFGRIDERLTRIETHLAEPGRN
jgi:uncharacterized coiled-coil protein SlyX